MPCAISTVDNGHRLVLSLHRQPPLQLNLFPPSQSLKFSASQLLPPHNPFVGGHCLVFPRMTGFALGGGGEGEDTSRLFIIPRAMGGLDTRQWGLSSRCPSELRKTYSAPPQPVVIRPYILVSLLRYGPLASERLLQMQSPITAIPQ